MVMMVVLFMMVRFFLGCSCSGVIFVFVSVFVVGIVVLLC